MAITTEQLRSLNLPADYATLTREGKRQARLAGVRKQGPSPDDFVRAWLLFRTYYLQQLPPGVFYKEYAPSPPLHYNIVRDVAEYRLNAWACPRGSAKSTILGTEVPLLLLLTRSNFEILLILAKESMVQRRVGKLMYQLETNPYILDDFGAVRPPRGGRLWNRSVLQLTNGAALVGMPVEGKLLGERPDMILIDDPEHDKAMAQDPNPAYLREAFERLLYGVIMPMLRRGTGLGWIGTLLDARSFLYSFVHSTELHVTRYWNRRNTAIWTPEGESIWEGRWSKTDIKELQDSMPDEYFQTHFMNRPGSKKGGLLKIDPQFTTYELEPEQDWNTVEPFFSDAMLVARRPIAIGDDDGVGVDEDVHYEADISERLLPDVLRTVRRYLLIDFGFSTKSSADYTSLMVVGYENGKDFRDTLWVLDLWLGHQKLSKLIPIIWQYAKRWRVNVVAAEAVAHQGQMLDPIKEFIDRQSMVEWGWRPLIVPVKYPAGVQKVNRIEALAWKFDRFRVKLPRQRRTFWPFKELFHEIEMFDSTMRGLRHDDALDSLAMFQFIGGGKPRTGPVEPGERRVDPVAELKAGNLFNEAGIPYMSMIPADLIPVEEIRRNHQRRQAEEDRREGGPVEWEIA